MVGGAPQSQPPKADQRYNKVFEKFVGNLDEAGNTAPLRGLLAYGFYKVAKREWVAQVKESKGRPPTDEELQDYAEKWTASLIQSTFDRSDQALAEYAQVVIQNEEPAILRRALRGSFWTGVRQSIAANFFYTLLLIGFAAVLRFSGIDVLSVFDNTKPVVERNGEAKD